MELLEQSFSELTVADAVFYFSNIDLPTSTVQKIENNLQPYEKVSLAFLLYDNNEDALQIVDQVISNSKAETNKSIRFLESYCNSHSNWKATIIEALLIIKAYREVSNLVALDDAQNHFLPDNIETSIFVHPLKKILYVMCEEFVKADTKQFVSWISEHTDFKHDDNDIDYLELFIVKLINKDIIKPGRWHRYTAFNQEENERCNISIITKYFQKIQNKRLLDAFTSIENLINRNDPGHTISNDKLSLAPESIPSINTNNVSNTSQAIIPNIKDIYKIIDEKSMGYFLIFNQKTFIRNDQNLKERLGTEQDVNHLNKVLSHYGFTVKVFDNQTCGQILNTLRNYVNLAENKHCAFGICILSHGRNDAIYGSDSKSLDIGSIKNEMLSPRLMGKPKIVLVQACRGDHSMGLLSTKRHKSKISTDGSDITAGVPIEGDLIIFWATVKSYVSYRDENNGSFFIQTLCKCLREHGGREHLLDIFTRVNNKVSEISTINCQISQIESTFRKFFYLRKKINGAM